MNKYKQGDKVKCNGYPGAIVRRYSENMYEVRLNSGLVCVDQCDITPIECVYCGISPNDQVIKACNAPDGDGHLFNY